MIEIFLIGIIGFFAVASVVLAAVTIRLMNRHKRYVEYLTKYQIHVSATIDSSIPEVLDLVIQESFKDYQIKVLGTLPASEFITSEKEANIRKDLVTIVTSRISNASLDKLSLFYNIENIADIIADKIYILVMNFVIQHNAPFYADETA